MATQSTAAALAALNAKIGRLDLGSINPSARMIFYTGAPVPASPDASLGAAVALVTLPMSIPAFAGAVDHSGTEVRATAAAITTTQAVTTGTWTFFRLVNRDNVPVHQGTESPDLITMGSIVEGATVSISSLILTELKSGPLPPPMP
jgi:hypothetical protein